MKTEERTPIKIVKGDPKVLKIDPAVLVNDLECKVEISASLIEKSIQFVATDGRGHIATIRLPLNQKITSFNFFKGNDPTWDWNWEVIEITIEPINFESGNIGLSISYSDTV